MSIRREFERLLVGGNRLFKIPFFGQRITSVVETIRALALAEALDRRREVPAAVGRGSRPGWIGEQRGGPFRVPLVQGPCALLVIGQP